MRLIDNIKISQPDEIAAAATEFTTDTNLVDMTKYNKCLAVLMLEQAGAGTGTIVLKQAATADGSDEKALAYAEYWKNITGVDTDDLTLVTASTCTDAGAFTGGNSYYFEVRGDMLDVENGFKYFRLDVASLSNNTAAALIYLPYEPRYARGAQDMPTGLA